MKDRVPNPLYVLANGAIRYGVYDESGDLVRYEYIKKEDDPIEAGTPLSKANLLDDTTAAEIEIKLGSEFSGATPTISEALYKIAGKLAARALVQRSSYVGTGTFGSGNPNELVCDFDPDYVLITQAGQIGILFRAEFFNASTLSGDVINYYATASTFKPLTMTYNSAAKTLSWYNSDNGQYQLNQSGQDYDVLIIGVAS